MDRSRGSNIEPSSPGKYLHLHGEQKECDKTQPEHRKARSNEGDEPRDVVGGSVVKLGRNYRERDSAKQVLISVVQHAIAHDTALRAG